MDLLVKGLVIACVAIAVAYTFAKVVEKTGSFTKGVLAVSLMIDFALLLLWILGIDRPLFRLYFARIGASITITALSVFIPLKLLFTIYLFLRSRQLQQVLG